MKKEKDLDKLFQEASKNAVFNDSTAGWSSMQSKLKTAGVVQGAKNRWFNLNSILIALLLLIITTGSVWYLVSEDSQLDKGLASGSLSSPSDVPSSMEESSSKKMDLGTKENTRDSAEFETTLSLLSSNEDVASAVLEPSELNEKKKQETNGLDDLPGTLESSKWSGDEGSAKSLDTPSGSKPVEIGQGNDLRNNVEVNKTASQDTEKRPSAPTDNTELIAEKERSKKLDSKIGAYSLITFSNVDSLTDHIGSMRVAGDKNMEEKIALSDGDESSANWSEDDADKGAADIIEKGNKVFKNEMGTTSDERDEYTYYAGPKLLLPVSEIFPVPFLAPGTEIKMVEMPEIVTEPVISRDSIFKRSRWSFGLELSPDLSTVGLRGAEDPGYTVGLHAEYHFSSKLSVSGGVSYSKKIYFADEGIESYPGTNPNWTLDRVNANCDVIDIPINLTYYLNGYSASGFVFGAGLSTYFMLTEDYDIIYNSPWPEGSQFFRNENQHFLGVLNASVGYRKQLNPVLSLQAEPYLKIPIQGIGAGDLDLYTSGLRLTLKYNRISTQR